MSSPPPSGRPRLNEFDVLRAIAITLVVLAHSVVHRPSFPALLRNLIAGGTCVFVFISGYFFREVFCFRYTASRFWMKRARALVPPFLTVSAIGAGLIIVGRMRDGAPPITAASDVLLAAVRRGYVLHPHWYIGFALLLFALAPLFTRFAKAPLRGQWGVFALATLVAALAHRPPREAALWETAAHSVIYFTPCYLLGILTAGHRGLFTQIKRPASALCLTALLAALLLQSYASSRNGNSHKPLFIFAGLDLILLQKLPECILLLYVCEHLKHPRLLRAVRLVSNASFAIFFLHALLCDRLVQLAEGLHAGPAYDVAATFVIATLGVLGSLLVATVVKRMTRHSRALIGY